jgi:hypothetical protein
MSESRRCLDCRFFDGARQYCRFSPPTMMGWPSTSPSDWCGEWTAPRTANQAGESKAARQVDIGLPFGYRPGARR